MTAVPLSPAEEATLARIEAAPAAEESLRVRVIKATHAAACNCGDEDPTWSTYWQRIADAAIAAMRGVS